MVLANEMSRWPSPKDFLDNLPPPPEPLKLEHRYRPSADEKARGKAVLKQIQSAVNAILNGKNIN